MSYHRLPCLHFLALPAITILLTTAAAGQVTSAKAKTAAAPKIWTQPRTADGQPDLQGIWNNATITPLERDRRFGNEEFLTKEEAAQYARDLVYQSDKDRRDGPPEVDVNRSYNQLFLDRGGLAELDGKVLASLIINPPDGRIPALTPEAQKKEAARRAERRTHGPADSWEDRNLAERCLTRGAPKLPGGYNNNFQIVQTKDAVMIMQEMIHETRVIPLDGRPHLPPTVRLWMGDSIGHWEGDTLVVDTTNYNDNVRFNSFNCCGPAGAGLHIVERFRRTGANTIDYRYTVEDPSTYTAPWTVAAPMTKIDEPLYEYACHEGNYAMEDMLRGARAQEKAAAEAAKAK